MKKRSVVRSRAEAKAAVPEPVLELAKAIKAKIDWVVRQLKGVPRVVIIEGKFMTAESAPTSFNIDLAGGLPIYKIKRYTVTIVSGMLGTRSGNLLQVVAGVLDSSVPLTADTYVLSGDPSALLTPGVSVGPYAGSNSFIYINRGADGLGNVEVMVNAYVEMLP